MDTETVETPAPLEHGDAMAMIPLEAALSLAWWEPRYDRIFVLPLLHATASENRLIVAGENRELPESGIVVAIGPGGLAPESGREVHVVAQPGDLVLFGKYAGQDTAVPRVTDIAPPRLIVMRDIEVLAAKPKDKYDWNELLVCHDLDPRKIHFKGHTCEFCPNAPKDEAHVRNLRALAFGDVVDAEVTEQPPAPTPEAEAAANARIQEERRKMREHERAQEQQQAAGDLPAGTSPVDSIL
jgi:co-chaperonin GroES (HSP10)